MGTMESPRIVYQQGDHVCTLYQTPEEQLAAAVQYIREGLSNGERCLYICCEHDVDAFRAALRDRGIDVDGEEKRGALLLRTKHDGHLDGGTFDPNRMIALLEAAVHDALRGGFRGLRAAGDMNWVLDNAPGTERLAEYEARLNGFYASNKALGLCQYNRKTLPSEALDHCIATHKHVAIGGPILLENPFYELPEEAFFRMAKTAEEVAARIRRISAAA